MILTMFLFCHLQCYLPGLCGVDVCFDVGKSSALNERVWGIMTSGRVQAPSDKHQPDATLLQCTVLSFYYLHITEMTVNILILEILKLTVRLPEYTCSSLLKSTGRGREEVTQSLSFSLVKLYGKCLHSPEAKIPKTLIAYLRESKEIVCSRYTNRRECDNIRKTSRLGRSILISTLKCHKKKDLYIPIGWRNIFWRGQLQAVYNPNRFAPLDILIFQRRG